METPDLATLIAEMQDTSKSSYQRTRSFEEFLKHPDHLSQLSAIETLLDDENRSLRNDVVRAIVRAVVPDYYRLLEKALDDADEYIKREALRGLTECTSSEIIAKVRSLAETATYSLKADAGRTLKAMEEASAEESEAELPRSDSGETAEPIVETVDSQPGENESTPEVEPAVQGVVIEPEVEITVDVEVTEPSSEDEAKVEPVVTPAPALQKDDQPPPLPKPEKDESDHIPPPLPKDVPPPLPKDNPPPKQRDRKERKTSSYSTGRRSRNQDSPRRKKEIKAEKSSCGPMACGCIILAIVGFFLAFILLFTTVSAKPSSSHNDMPKPVPYSY